MASIVRRFIKEAICRETLNTYNAIYRLDNGKYYHIITDAYDEKEARRRVKRRLSDATYHEYEPSEYYKGMIENHKGLYVFYRGKAE